MAAVIIGFARALVFVLVTASAILSLYAAMNALAVSTNLDVFASGLIAIAMGVVVAPLFCFIAGYGLVLYLDQPLWEAIVVTAPIGAAWCVVAFRLLAGVVTR